MIGTEKKKARKAIIVRNAEKNPTRTIANEEDTIFSKEFCI
jgi:hypothetical protein